MKLNYYNFIIIGLVTIIILVSIIFLTLQKIKIPKENFTELYFENYFSLPIKIFPNKTYEFSFIVKNFENMDMRYNYKFLMKIYKDNNLTIRKENSQEFTLKNEEEKKFTQKFSISEEFEKVKFEIILTYDNKSQDIYFWAFKATS